MLLHYYEMSLLPLISKLNSQYATRSTSSHKLQILQHSKSADDNCFYYSASKLWNALN